MVSSQRSWAACIRAMIGTFALRASQRPLSRLGFSSLL
jgi:hypothetical protein